MSRATHTLIASALIVLLAGVTACSLNPGVNAPPSSDPSHPDLTWRPHVRTDPALAAQLPDDVRATGVLRVATSSSLPPMTYVAGDNVTLVGFDVDMATVVADVLGLRAKISTAGFDTLIPGLQSGRFAMVMSSMGVTAERQKVVDFVDYYYGGEGFLASRSTDFRVERLKDLCGRRVAVQTGSTQQSTLEDSRQICPDAGLPPYDLQAFPGTNAAVLAIRGNRVDVLYASISIVGYTAAQNDDFRVAGRYQRAIVGAALAKDSPLTPLVRQAIQRLIDDGTYGRLLDQWGLMDSAVKTARINSAGTS